MERKIVKKKKTAIRRKKEAQQNRKFMLRIGDSFEQETFIDQSYQPDSGF
jgi:hypothetical protein